jgi:hypothetical protein
MLDRLSVVMPDWKERTPADMQIALVELMAYVGDSLSYFQDAVATEAYLGTARKRISVRRHARLLDYAIHEGSNARAWVSLAPDKGSAADGATVRKGTPLLTGAGRAAAVDRRTQNAFESESTEVFETMHDLRLDADRNLMRFYTWSSVECCLPKGATRATLVGRADDGATGVPLISPGDALVFEEVLSPATGLARDADPARRCVVRLSVATPSVDSLTGTPVVQIAWSEEDALPFPLCLSARSSGDDGRPTLVEPTVARGNLVLADHGATSRDEPLVPPVVPGTGPYRPTLASPGLTFQGPVRTESAAAAVRFDPREARPVIILTGDGGVWTPQSDLLGSDGFSRHFVVEMQADGVACLRFGDGIAGRKPTPGATFTASYRTGNGTRGNVGPGAIACIVSPDGDGMADGIATVRNPLAAAGGRDPETLEQVRQFAPQAFRTQERAVTEADYAEVTARQADVQGAAATFRWTGSWFTAFVTVDGKGGLPVDKTSIAQFLQRYRMAGYDLEISSTQFVPLDLALTVCVKPGYFQSAVKQAVLDVLSNRDLPDGTRGLFHPDNFTFGQSLYLSQIYRTVMQMSGVASVNVTRFQRWGKDANHELERGVLTAAPLEILLLANDPSFPESGRLGVTAVAQP